MRKVVIHAKVPDSEWLRTILPGFEKRVEQGANVEIHPERVKVDRRGEKLYNPSEPGEDGGATSEAP